MKPPVPRTTPGRASMKAWIAVFTLAVLGACDWQDGIDPNAAATDDLCLRGAPCP